MRSLLHRRLLIGGLAAGLVSLLAVSTALASYGHSVKVTLSEFKVAPNPKSTSAGKVTFTVKNAGDVEHEMVVVKTTKAASKLAVSGGRASTKGQVPAVEDIAAGKSKKVTVNLKKGHYVLICNIPGHYGGGMHSDFTVK